MTQKGYEVLKALLENNLINTISEIIVGRDKNIENDFADEIIECCLQNNIPCLERTNNFEVLGLYSIAVSWRWIINNKTSNLIVLHDSLLPRYRGFSPLVNSLINGETKIGVSAIFASDEYDAGDIILQSSTEIIYPIKVSQAINLITLNYIELILKLMNMISQNLVIKGFKQDNKLATYSLWRDENDYLIDWSKSANQILNFINAVSTPYKGAVTYINGKQRIRIFDAVLVEDVKVEHRDCGKTIFINQGQPTVVCGSGLLKLTEVVDDITKESIIPFKKFRVKLCAKIFC